MESGHTFSGTVVIRFWGALVPEQVRRCIDLIHTVPYSHEVIKVIHAEVEASYIVLIHGFEDITRMRAS